MEDTNRIGGGEDWSKGISARERIGGRLKFYLDAHTPLDGRRNEVKVLSTMEWISFSG